MLYSLTVTNSIGESLTLELSNPMASGYAIKTIDGLGTPDMNVNTTPYGIGDGSVLGSIKAEYRLITIVLYPLSLPRIEDTRQKLYRYFQIKKPILLTFVTDNRLVTIDGYVQNIDPNIFDNPESISIEVKCLNPYFHKMENGQSNFYGVTPEFEFPFSVEFDIVGGMTWRDDEVYGAISEWSDAVYANGLFIGVGRDGERSGIAYSYGGEFWNEAAALASPISQWTGIAYGNGMFVSALKDSNIGMYSTDGKRWELFSVPYQANWGMVAYGNGLFVIFLQDGNTCVCSSNLVDWKMGVLPVGGKWKKLIFGNDTFVAMEEDSDVAVYSSNGSVWYKVPFPIVGSWYDVAYGNGQFIFTRTGTGTWLKGDSITNLSTITQPIPNHPYLIEYVDNKFIAIQNNAKDGFYSVDGVSWRPTNLPTSKNWSSVAGGDGKVVVFAKDGYVAVSDIAYEYTDPIEFSSFSIDNRTEIEYEGEIDAGLRIIIECQSTPGDIVIYNIDTLEYIQIFSERIKAVTGSELGPKDVIEINTESGEKYVRLLRDGKYYNILGAMNRGMTWFTLKQGPNHFTYTTSDEHAAIVMSFIYRDTYAAI